MKKRTQVTRRYGFFLVFDVKYIDDMLCFSSIYE